jgi:hypothetical protein
VKAIADVVRQGDNRALLGRRRLPKRKTATRRINRWRLGVYSAEGKPLEEKVCFT